jgi:Uma2 family endonuclease
MNHIPRDFSSAPGRRPTTQAAEGLPRWRWTLAEFERLSELGFFGEDEHVELIEGELVPMPAKGIRHEIVRGKLLNRLVRQMPVEVNIFSEPGWRPGGDNYREPDLIFGPADSLAPFLPPDQVLLLIEVARTSLAFDTTTKADLYAALGVREYWVVDAQTLATWVYTGPTEKGFADRKLHKPRRKITPTLVPALAVRLADLGIE